MLYFLIDLPGYHELAKIMISNSRSGIVLKF